MISKLVTFADAVLTVERFFFAYCVEASNVINVPKCNKGPKCNKNLILNVIQIGS